MSAPGLPPWTSSYAALDDAALAALASRGLLRRARAEVAAGRVRLGKAAGPEGGADWSRVLTVDVGQPPVHVALLPEGPQEARCPCPVAGTCLHVVAACLLVRHVVEEERAREQDGQGRGDHRGQQHSQLDSQLSGQAGPPARAAAGGAGTDEDGGLPQGGRAVGGAGSGAPEGRTATAVTSAPGPGPLAEILGWEPAEVSRALGAVARRRAAAALAGRAAAELARETTLLPGEDQVVVTWPGSPRVIVVPGLGPRGIIVAGRRSAAAGATVRLEAVVRIFAQSGRQWPWEAGGGRGQGAAGAGDPAGLTAGQQTLVEAVLTTVEALVSAGLSHVGQRGAQGLSRLAEQARLEALPRLSRLLGTAGGVLGGVAARQDEAGESGALSALSAAWSLATALSGASQPAGASPTAGLAGLVGQVGSAAWQEAQPGLLVPLGARWWRSASGGRGLTVRFWDRDHLRVESVTTGRAAGQDPGFRRSQDAALVWGTSVGSLLSAPQRLEGARRRADGTLAPSTRTTVTPSGRLEDVDLPGLARGLAGLRQGPGAAGFERPAPAARLVLTSPGDAGRLGLDEVHQHYVWSLTGAQGDTHRLRLEETAELEVVAAVLAGGPVLRAVVVEGPSPVGLFVTVGEALRLVSPTMTTVGALSSAGAGGSAGPAGSVGTAGWRLARRLCQRMDGLRQAASPVPPAPPEGPVASLCRDLSEALTTLAASGRLRPEGPQAYTLARRRRQAQDMGLTTLVSALEEVTERPGPTAVLRATAVLDRLRALAG